MVTLNTVRNSLAAYTPSSKALLDVKTAISVYVDADPQLSNEEVINRVREDLPVESLYETNVIQGPSTLFRTVRDYLSFKGLHYEQHPDNNQVARGSPRMLYTTSQEREYAYLSLNRISGHPYSLLLVLPR